MKKAASLFLSSLLALAILGCASSAPPKPPPKPPDWAVVPSVVLEAVCAKLRSEAVSTDAPIRVVTTTQPLTSPASLTALANLFFKQGGSVQLAMDAVAAKAALPLTMPTGSCTFQPITKLDRRRDVDAMVLELSPPFVNPYVKTESGLFARLSIGGRDAQWYWMPLAEHKGHWAMGMISALDLHD